MNFHQISRSGLIRPDDIRVNASAIPNRGCHTALGDA